MRAHAAHRQPAWTGAARAAGHWRFAPGSRMRERLATIGGRACGSTTPSAWREHHALGVTLVLRCDCRPGRRARRSRCWTISKQRPEAVIGVANCGRLAALRAAVACAWRIRARAMHAFMTSARCRRCARTTRSIWSISARFCCPSAAGMVLEPRALVERAQPARACRGRDDARPRVRARRCALRSERARARSARGARPVARRTR